MSNFVPNDDKHLRAVWLTASGDLQDTALLGHTIGAVARPVADAGTTQRPFVILDERTDQWRSVCGKHSGPRSLMAGYLMGVSDNDTASRHFHQTMSKHDRFNTTRSEVVALLDSIEAVAHTLTPEDCAAALKLTATIATAEPKAWPDMLPHWRTAFQTITTIGGTNRGRSNAKADESIQQND